MLKLCSHPRIAIYGFNRHYQCNLQAYLAYLESKTSVQLIVSSILFFYKVLARKSERFQSEAVKAINWIRLKLKKLLRFSYISKFSSNTGAYLSQYRLLPNPELIFSQSGKLCAGENLFRRGVHCSQYNF